jgi:glutathione S-transferase
LGKKFGFYPSEQYEFNALQIALSVADFQMEGQNAYHPVDPNGSYADQMEEAKVSIAKFSSVRIPMWLRHFDHAIKLVEGHYLYGSTLTYADIALYHVLSACEAQFPEVFAAQVTPETKAFVDRVASHPPLAAYLASDRCRPWGGDSMM